jgi:hypothetical protein
MQILKLKYGISKGSTYDLIGFQTPLQFYFKKLINIPKGKTKHVPYKCFTLIEAWIIWQVHDKAWIIWLVCDIFIRSGILASF